MLAQVLGRFKAMYTLQRSLIEQEDSNTPSTRYTYHKALIKASLQLNTPQAKINHPQDWPLKPYQCYHTDVVCRLAIYFEANKEIDH